MLVTSDAQDAIAATLPGASWRRCRTHFMRNLLTRVPKSAQPFVATLVRSIFAQPDAEQVREQHARVVAQLEERFAAAALLLEAICSTTLNRARIRRAISEASPWQGISGPITWDGTGQNTRPVTRMGIISQGALKVLDEPGRE